MTPTEVLIDARLKIFEKGLVPRVQKVLQEILELGEKLEKDQKIEIFLSSFFDGYMELVGYCLESYLLERHFFFVKQQGSSFMLSRAIQPPIRVSLKRKHCSTPQHGACCKWQRVSKVSARRPGRCEN